ncbi:hypothetical protein [Alicyclobacillus acidoterrestris]|nr:hypothetical protein [Alicyclobacillus acidoterrestris]EPZ40662.1 hypothetical protein N007_17890 [Alicyclobacillus acidoterrestris ATCC 49025]
MAIRHEDVLRKEEAKKKERRALIRQLAKEICDENDEALRRLSKS